MTTFFEPELFDYDEQEHTFTAFASDIDFEPSLSICLGIGPNNVTFDHSETVRDNDNDITHWIYTIRPHQKFNGEITATTVVIYND